MNWIIITISVIATQVFSGTPNKPEAYLDPGSGSFIFQLILASILGGAFVVRAYWKRISIFIQNIFSKKPRNDENDK